MKLETEFGIYDGVFLRVGEYRGDGSVAIQAWNRQDGCICTLTVCLCDPGLEEGESYIDTNNCPWAIEFIEKEGLGKRTGIFGHSGFCTYPIVKFDMEKVRERMEA